MLIVQKSSADLGVNDSTIHNMSAQKYSVNQQLVETLLSWVKSGEIAIPEIQPPFCLDPYQGSEPHGLSLPRVPGRVHHHLG